MENRFKFRFWDKQVKLMVDCAKCSMVELPKVFNDDNRFVKMQSTGLKDKNGKLIYEGDIVKLPTQCNKELHGNYSLQEIVWRIKWK